MSPEPAAPSRGRHRIQRVDPAVSGRRIGWWPIGLTAVTVVTMLGGPALLASTSASASASLALSAPLDQADLALRLPDRASRALTEQRESPAPTKSYRAAPLPVQTPQPAAPTTPTAAPAAPVPVAAPAPSPSATPTVKPTTKPAPAAAKAPTTTGGISSAPCAGGSAMESGLTPDAIRVHRAVCALFPSVLAYGGLRGSGGEHGAGRAVDIMIPSSAVGSQIAAWVRANAKILGASEVIWSQHIWTVQRSGEGWRAMSDRGSPTANHYDHVHVTVYGSSGG